MTKAEDFAALVDRAMRSGGLARMRPVIEKELLHYDILFCLDNEGLLDSLTFQGGTSLRLCYGAVRLSEDLDFTGGVDFSGAQLTKMKVCLERYIGRRYGLEVSVKEPNELREEPEYRGLKVDKWQISVVTAPKQKHLPRQRIKIEVANVPSYSRIPRALQVNYPFLPDGYGDTLILTETLDELMADKLVSLVNTQRYTRHRDIWDLRWLKQNGATVRLDWIKAKIADYNITHYMQKLGSMIERLPEIVHGDAFNAEMQRFLPRDVLDRTLLKQKFAPFLAAEVESLLLETQTSLAHRE